MPEKRLSQHLNNSSFCYILGEFIFPQNCDISHSMQILVMENLYER